MFVLDGERASKSGIIEKYNWGKDAHLRKYLENKRLKRFLGKQGFMTKGGKVINDPSPSEGRERYTNLHRELNTLVNKTLS